MEPLTIQDITNYVNSWRSENGITGTDALTTEQATNFLSDLNIEIAKMSFEPPVEGAKIIPYSGNIGDMQSWEIAKLATQGSGGEYCYISDLEPGQLLKNDDFMDAVGQAVGDPNIAESMFEGGDSAYFADDGVLVLYRNNNGIIDDGGELFGDQTVLSNEQLATDGFQALADLDANQDGIIDANDAQFANIKVLKGDGTLEMKIAA